MNKIILISGIPGSGKSTYTQWLEKEKGFICWDFEHETLEDVSNRSGFYVGTNRDFESLFKATITIDKTLVIDWGFSPVTALDKVEWLIKKGVVPYWFDGDREAAKISFLKRNTVPEKDLNIQMQKIERAWTEIEKLFSKNIIKVIKSGPEYMSPEKIYNKMF